MAETHGSDTLGARLVGRDPVETSARLVRHYRYAVERMMRTMAGWIALTPELSAKLLLGRQVWDSAQHADLWGRRLPELRAQAQISEPSSGVFVAFMDDLESPVAPHQTIERLAGLYRVLKPHLLATYVAHHERTNPVYEPPTRRLLARCIDDERRHVAAGETVLAHLTATPALVERARAWQSRLDGLLAAAGGVTGTGLPPLPPSKPAVAEPDLVDDAREFIRLEQHGRNWEVPADLASALAGLGAGLLSGDVVAVRRLLRPECRWSDADTVRVAAGGATGHGVVAFAKLGGHRLVKQRLDGPRGSVSVISRWVPGADGWRVSVLDAGPIDAIEPA
jgi:hypothetical protein